MHNSQSQQKNWQNMDLGDVCDIKTGKKDVNQGGEGGEYPFFTCARETLRSNDYSFDANSILIAGNGSYTGFTKKYSGKFDLYQRTYALLNFDKSVNFEFLFYYLKDRFEYKYMGGSHGAAIPYITKPILSDFEVVLPPLPTQKQIADVLSAYDELIENNTRRIQILEELAQAIYKEWFVYFRFPGHEKVKMIDSGTEFGMIPEGWSIGKLSDLVDLTMGQSPKSEFYNQNKEGLPFHQGVTNFGVRFPNTKTYSTEGVRKAKAGDILFSVRAPVGRLNIAPQEVILGRGLAGIRNRKNEQSFQFYQLKHLFHEEDIIGGGSIFNSVTKNELENFEILIPNQALITSFNESIESFDKLIFNLSESIEGLRQARDLLLPKLVIGEIEVKK